MRHKCSLLKHQRADDGIGGGELRWVTQRYVWAEIATPSGRTAVLAQQVSALLTAEIRCRPAPDLVAGLRLVHGSMTYLIEAALPDNERSMLRLLCSSVPNP